MIKSLLLLQGRMNITPQILVALLLVTASSYDCYDQKCEGKWGHLGDFIKCDQQSSRCRYDKSGRPRCAAGSSGAGVDCRWPYQCKSFDLSGTAYCGENFVMMVVLIMGPAILLTTVAIFYLCCCRRRCLSRGERSVTVQQRAPLRRTKPVATKPVPAKPVPTQPALSHSAPSQPAVVIKNINSVSGPSASSSNQRYYGTTGYSNNSNNTNKKAGYQQYPPSNQKGIVPGAEIEASVPPVTGYLPSVVEPLPTVAPPAYHTVFSTAPSAPPCNNEFDSYPNNPYYQGP